MTVRCTDRDGFARALVALADDIDRGLVVSCSIHYEPSDIARLSICYVRGGEEASDLPKLPGISVDSAEEDTEPN